MGNRMNLVSIFLEQFEEAQVFAQGFVLRRILKHKNLYFCIDRDNNKERYFRKQLNRSLSLY